MYSDIYCGSFKINSLGPKRLLKTQIFGAKGKLSSQEMISVFFSRIFDCDKPQGTICKGPEGILAIIVKAIRSFM